MQAVLKNALHRCSSSTQSGEGGQGQSEPTAKTDSCCGWESWRVLHGPETQSCRVVARSRLQELPLQHTEIMTSSSSEVMPGGKQSLLPARDVEFVTRSGLASQQQQHPNNGNWMGDRSSAHNFCTHDILVAQESTKLQSKIDKSYWPLPTPSAGLQRQSSNTVSRPEHQGHRCQALSHCCTLVPIGKLPSHHRSPPRSVH